MHTNDAEASWAASSDDDQQAASYSSNEAADDSVAASHADPDANLPPLQVPRHIPLHVLLTFNLLLSPPSRLGLTTCHHNTLEH